MTGRLVLTRHGQSVGNVEHRLDTRPPGSELTPLGLDQARTFAGSDLHRPVLVAHSIATRAVQTATVIGDRLQLSARVLTDIHEVQVGALEGRSDEDAIAEFTAIYRGWQRGDLDRAMPGGETGRQVLDRYLPVIADLRGRYLDDEDFTGDIVVVSHGAAIRLVAAALAEVAGEFAIEHQLANTESVVLAPAGDGGWTCVRWGLLTPPFDVAVPPVADAHPMG